MPNRIDSLNSKTWEKCPINIANTSSWVGCFSYQTFLEKQLLFAVLTVNPNIASLFSGKFLPQNLMIQWTCSTGFEDCCKQVLFKEETWQKKLVMKFFFNFPGFINARGFFLSLNKLEKYKNLKSQNYNMSS